MTSDNRSASLLSNDQVSAAAARALNAEGVSGTPKPDLLQGTLDLLILKSPRRRPAARLGDLEADPADVEGVADSSTGLALPALYRLEDRGWIAGEEADRPRGAAIKVYR